MRNMLFALSAVGALIAGPAAAQTYGDAYDAPGAVVINPPAIVAPPMVQSPVYLAPGATVVAPMAPGSQYADAPIYMNGQRYYRDCWWDWGQRRCELKPWW